MLLTFSFVMHAIPIGIHGKKNLSTVEWAWNGLYPNVNPQHSF